ncbi:unnamed protein product [Scytosiphon promiscuus]
MRTKAGIDPSVSNPCVVCEKATVDYQCKLCKGYIYCSKGCCKADTKKHKRSCSSLASYFRNSSLASSETLSRQTSELLRKHVLYMTAKHQKMEEEKAEGRARPRSVLGRHDKAAEDNHKDKILAALAECSAASADADAAAEKKRELIARLSDIRAAAACAFGDAARSAPESYGDSDYWEERHARSRENDETYEWYTGYPGEALRKAFPRSVRDKKTLVVGCGNSELSEKMCQDGFRDVLSIDTSKSAIEQMSKRAQSLNIPRTNCRYQVMDATRLDNLDSGTFGGVVDKGTIDAVLSEGLEPARRICREAMRVLEPGGRFLVISNTPGEKLLETLLDMCGPGSTVVDSPLAVPVSARGPADSLCVYAYIVHKSPGTGGGSDGGSASPTGSNGDAHRLERSAERGSSGAGQKGGDCTAGGREGALGGGDRGAPVLGGAPLSDRHVPELGVGPEERRRKPGGGGGGGGDGVDRGREGQAAGECPPLSDNLRELSESLEQLPQEAWGPLEEEEEEHQAGSGKVEELEDSPACTTRERCAVEGEDDREEHEKTERRSPTQTGSRGDVRPGPTRRDSEDDSPLPKQKRGKGPRMTRADVLTAAAVLEDFGARPCTGDGDGVTRPPSEFVPADQVPWSLPWGSQERFNNYDTHVVYELRLEAELSPSKLTVEVGPSRLKVSYLRRPGEREVLVDQELFDKVAAESTWSIEDRRLLTFTLYKRVEKKWPHAFRFHELEQLPACLPPGGVGMRKAGASSVSSDMLSREMSPAIPENEPSRRLPAPPAVPRKHERSPKVDLRTGHNFKAPERFLLEDHAGIKKLQLYLSKPRGLKVTRFQVSRVGPEVCEVRFVCRDESGTGRPDARFLQRALLGRRGFHPDQASCSGEAPDDLCVVGVPYRTDDDDFSPSECVGGGSGSGDLDDEGVPRVARLRCRFCGHLVTPAGKGLAVRAMPTGRWDECIEDMICFDGPQAVPMLSGDVNFARPGRCLMAQVEVLLHPRDIVPGAVVLNEDPAEAVSREETGDSGGFPAESEEGPQWRSLECARCDLPLGRPAAPRTGLDGGGGFGGGVSKEDRGLLLLKHCLLGDDLGGSGNDLGDDDNACDVTGGGKKQQATDGGGGGDGDGGRGTTTTGEGSGSGQQGSGPSGSPVSLAPLPTVFEHRTTITWLMGEMSFFNERDGCARFIVSARGRSPAAPCGSLSLVLAKMNSLVSVDGGSKPVRAHRIAFREESQEEAERADEEETWGDQEAEASPSPPPLPSRGEAAAGGGEGGARAGKTAAKVPARALEVSYGEYAAVRERLRRAAWAGAPYCKLDPRGYSYSYLF